MFSYLSLNHTHMQWQHPTGSLPLSPLLGHSFRLLMAMTRLQEQQLQQQHHINNAH